MFCYRLIYNYTLKNHVKARIYFLLLHLNLLIPLCKKKCVQSQFRQALGSVYMMQYKCKCLTLCSGVNKKCDYCVNKVSVQSSSVFFHNIDLIPQCLKCYIDDHQKAACSAHREHFFFFFTHDLVRKHLSLLLPSP